jgi:predicted PurR-regulated permease PerM
MMGDWTMMTGYGPAHWLIFAIIIAAILYPLGRILTRIGFSPFWCVLALIPVVNLFALWALAFADWPGRERTTAG